MSSRLFNDANPDYIEAASALVTAVPLTMACWALLDDSSNNVDSFMSIGNSTGNGNYFGMDVAGVSAGDPFRVHVGAGAGTYTHTTLDTNGAAYNNWRHYCGVWESATQRHAYYQGSNVGQTQNTTSRVPTGLDRTQIGCTYYEAGVVRNNPASGKIALPAFWNVALEADEIAALARGVHPRRIRPESLVSCPPLWGNHSPEIDLIGSGLTWTVTGTSRAEDGPPVGLWMPYRPSIIVPAAVAGGTILPQMIQQGLYANG